MGVDDFVLLWAEEGLGAAIVIDGRLHRGATGGAGEVGFLPLPGTPLVRQVGRSNAGGFQELAGGKQVLALARSMGLRARTPESAVALALTTPGSGDELLQQVGERVALGLASIVAAYWAIDRRARLAQPLTPQPVQSVAGVADDAV